MLLDSILTLIISNLEESGYAVDRTELSCIARNVFFEARGETITDKIYVANVTKNRVNDKRWGDTYCGVVNQPYQFSWTHENHDINKLLKNKQELIAFYDSVEVAGLVMTGLLDDTTHGSTHYHRNDITIGWTKNLQMVQVATVSKHIFYK